MNTSGPPYTGDGCTGVGSSAVSGLAFYPPTGAGNYPASYRGALFYADVTRKCIWYMTPDANGLPQVSSRKNFITNANWPVDLQIGPNNDLFYVDYGGSGPGGNNPGPGAGKIWRVRYQSPTAIATANPTSGFAPLTVQYTGSMSTPGIAGDTLSYAWDLDGDGQYDDSTAMNPSRTYNVAATFNARLRVTDQRGGVGESSPIQIVVGSTTEPPAPVIDTPTTALTWAVGDTISFTGHATDPEDGNIPASGLLWDVIMQHCPGHLPRAPGAELRRRGRRQLPDARPRVPLVPAAAPDRHRQPRRAHDRHPGPAAADRAADPAGGPGAVARPEHRLQPGRQLRHAIHPHGRSWARRTR